MNIVRLPVAYVSENHIHFDINAKNKDDNYPLIYFMNYNNLNMVQLLLDHPKEN